MRKMQSFNENMLGKFLGFGYIHENKFFFLKKKRKIDLKVFEIFFISEIFQRKPGILILNLYFTE